MNLIPTQYRFIAKLVSIGLVLFVCFSIGWVANGWRLNLVIKDAQLLIASQYAEGVSSARKIERLSNELAQSTDKLLAKEIALQQAISQTNTVEVIKYVQQPYSGKCDIPVGWVRIDTASASGVSKDVSPTSLPDGASSGLTDSDLLGTITERNRICRVESGKLRLLQEYVRNQLKIFGANND